MFANIVWPKKLEKIHTCYIFSIQNIDGSCIFIHSLAKLANMLKARNLANIPPPALGGLSMVGIYNECCGDPPLKILPLPHRLRESESIRQ